MRKTIATFAVFFALGSVCLLRPSRGQEPGRTPITRTIDVYRGAPIKGAVETLRERYHLPITYEDPGYACACDLADMTYTRKKPGPKILVPKRQSLHFEYVEVVGKPQEGITTLLRRLATQFATQGGTVFDVRERALPKGTQWNVVAVRARRSSGDFADQPDILGAPIFIAKAKRTQAEFLQEMVQQLTTATGYQVRFGGSDSNVFMGTAELGVDNVSAREALTDLYGGQMVWELNYDPENGGRYFLNLVWTTTPILPSLDDVYDHRIYVRKLFRKLLKRIRTCRRYPVAFWWALRIPGGRFKQVLKSSTLKSEVYLMAWS